MRYQYEAIYRIVLHRFTVDHSDSTNATELNFCCLLSENQPTPTRLFRPQLTHPPVAAKFFHAKWRKFMHTSSIWNGRWLELSLPNFFSSSSSVSSWTQLIQLSQLKSALRPSSVSSQTQLSQLLDPSHPAHPAH
ncbi:hypothetical protein PGTUg99_017292 [Puccinia graminis f. sp. tritici]|uniref:Uncharacterized protein n=1 Tax=Puccinia graminis f. sp. tritici TaxID=56615 RepID=A0A5B0QLE9_PUCGR|nr:hypothetical protein PGTUg99_017292 [Puccinia graminis f. sp. tritici]